MKIGNITLSSKRAHIAASFWEELSFAQLKALREQGLSVVEIRVDKMQQQSLKSIEKLCSRFSEMPLILTIRSRSEGGMWNESENARFQLLLETMAFADIIDVELSSDFVTDIIDVARTQKKQVLVSEHHFHRQAATVDLSIGYQQAMAMGADIYKYAGLCLNESDLLTLKQFSKKYKHEKIIVIGMDNGENNFYAYRSRLELPRCGSCLAFAAGTEKSAPGQLTLKETYEALSA